MTRRNWVEINQRRFERYAIVGLQTEEKIAVFLVEIVDDKGDKIFEEVVHHEQNSHADWQGKDITVYRRIDGVLHRRSFGVTTSIKRFNQTKKKHEIPVFYTPVNFNPQSLLCQKFLTCSTSIKSARNLLANFFINF